MDRIRRLGEAVLKWLGDQITEEEMKLLADYGVPLMAGFLRKCATETRDPYLIGVLVVGYCAVKGGVGEACQRLYNGVANEEEHEAIVIFRDFAPPSCIPYGADITKLNSW
jgi:hypothetical protein